MQFNISEINASYRYKVDFIKIQFSAIFLPQIWWVPTKQKGNAIWDGNGGKYKKSFDKNVLTSSII